MFPSYTLPPFTKADKLILSLVYAHALIYFQVFQATSSHAIISFTGKATEMLKMEVWY